MSNDLTDFHGQTVLVVGAAQGLGLATARLIASRGAQIIAMDIDIDGLQSLKVELQLSDNQISQIDMGSFDSVTERVSSALKTFGRIDALVNTVGLVGPSNTKVEDISWESFEALLRVNLFGTIWLTQAVIPAMKAAKYGRIAHVSSIAGKEGNPGMAPYNVSKAGMIGFVKGIAKEVATDGIVINAFAPAVMRTGMNANTSQVTLDYMLSRIPMGRLGEPEEAAEMLAFMVSKACSFTTGAVFDASGGRATY